MPGLAILQLLPSTQSLAQIGPKLVFPAESFHLDCSQNEDDRRVFVMLVMLCLAFSGFQSSAGWISLKELKWCQLHIIMCFNTLTIRKSKSKVLLYSFYKGKNSPASKGPGTLSCTVEVYNII